MIISWFSAGVSSAVATKIAIQKYGDVRIVYTHIEDQHEDTLRFLRDCEQWFGIDIEMTQSPLKNVNNACLQSSFIKSPYGAPCTRLLKRRVRKEWEIENLTNDDTYVWGFDLQEKHRAERLYESMPEFDHYFPLIENEITKQDAHGMLEKAEIKRPVMYELGYPNNNCIGCLKGGMGYWNKIRNDFPEIFDKRCYLEEVINGQIFKEFKLKDLPKDAGREQKVIVPDCGFFCEIPE